jgi:chemotaxis protein methyltransferase CheR
MTEHLFLLRDLIQERTGLFFRDYLGVEWMASGLKSRLDESGCESFSEYYRFLSEGEKAAADEWLHVIAKLTKPASAFFRHAKFPRLLVDTVIPRLSSNKDTKTLKIWSAACSTGEEPLTIAMALSEAGWFDRVEIEIYASDASFVAIEKARRGMYGESRMRSLSSELRSKYFTPATEGWQVKPELHKRIRWSMANLVNESEIARLAASDIIFCRNVFIYFAEPAICRTLDLFGKQMPFGGYLFTDEGDYFESLMARHPTFEQQKIGGASIWMKRNESAQRGAARSSYS